MNWLPYIPLSDDVQVSHISDFLACCSYSAVHIAEMVEKRRTGQFWEISCRALAKMSGTTKKGNDISSVVSSIEREGLILDRDWDNLTYSNAYNDISWEEYYKPIPKSVLKKAQPFEVRNFKKLKASDLATAIKIAPLWTIIPTSGGIDHIVAQLNLNQGQWGMGQYYDSYEVRVKDFQLNFPIKSQYLLELIPKKMTNSLLVKKGNEWGIYVPAIDEVSLIDKSLNFGLALPTKNNGKSIDWENVKADIIIP